jgi:PAS domain S-box-containing protein
MSQGLKTQMDDSLLEHKADSVSELASQYYQDECFESSLKEFFVGIEYLRKQGNIVKQINFYHQIITIFIRIKNFELGKKYLKTLTDLCKRTNNFKAKNVLNLSYGKYYIAIEQYDSAIGILYLCLPSLSKVQCFEQESIVYQTIGDAFVKKKEYGLAIYNYSMSLNAYSKISHYQNIAAMYTRIAHIHYLTGNYLQNLLFNIKAMRIREISGDSTLLSSSYTNVGEAYFLLGKSDSAKYFIYKSLEMIIPIKKSFYQEVVYRSLTQFALSKGNYREALEFNKKCVDARIKFNLEKNRSEILILEANQSIYENDAQNDLLKQEIIIQKLQINNRKLQLIGYEAIFLSFITLIFVIDYLARNSRNKKLKLSSINDRLLIEIKGNQEAGQNLKQSIELHRFLAENTVDVISLLNADLSFSYISSSCVKLFGLTSDKIMAMKSLIDLVDPEYQMAIYQKVIEILHIKKPTRVLFKALRSHGPSFWAEANLNPLINPGTHEVKEIIVVVCDYSENKKFEDEIVENARQKEMLLREIHNRVKNNFAILGSLIHLLPQDKSDDSLSVSLIDLQLRIRTMSLVHELLYKSQKNNTIPFDEYLQNLCWIIASAFKSDRIEIGTETCKCNLSIEMTLPIGLILNEMLTNAYKYAFPGNTKGKVTVKLEAVSNDIFRISVCDNGIGLPDNFNMENSSSMGTKIIGILVQQIEGKISFSSNHGTCFHIEFSATQEK